VENASMSEFERLLKERVQIEQWLERLNESGDKTPEKVRERVMSDYRKRLDEVQEELNGHRDEITAALDRHRSVRDGLVEQEAEAEERRAEAELRHTVGEFDDNKWNGIRDEIDGSLSKIREELSGVDAEVADLEKALASLAPADNSGDEAAKTPETKEPPSEPADKPKPTADELPPPIREYEQPAAPKPTATSPSDGADESLKFLDVDAGEENKKPAPARQSDTVSMPPDAAETLGKPDGTNGAAIGADDVTSFSESSDPPKKGAAKTLKCGECGTMNLPTEWYCERCGAELAAL
jgi:hypothetical protein